MYLINYWHLMSQCWFGQLWLGKGREQNKLWIQCGEISWVMIGMVNLSIFQLYFQSSSIYYQTFHHLFSMSSESPCPSYHTNRKPRDFNSLTNDCTSICTIDPIHSGSQLSFLSIKHKLSPPKPAFGTSSSRLIHQLNGNKLSDIVAYSRINYQKNQKYLDRYQQIQPKLSPFLTTSPRFHHNHIQNPGPGQYTIPQILKLKQTTNSNQGPMFCPFKRWQSHSKQSSLLSKKPSQINHILQLSNKQNRSSLNSCEVQLKIKEKRQEIKQKMLILKDKMKKPKQSHGFQMKRMGFSQKQENMSQKIQWKKKKLPQESVSPTKTFKMKQATSKYLPKLNYQFERSDYRTAGQIKNFNQAYKNQAVFVSKNDSVFSSYISKSENPGPGHYEKKEKKMNRTRQNLKIDNFLI